MIKVAIFAEILTSQLDYLRSLAQENNIQAQFVVESDSATEENNTLVTRTELTGIMLQECAAALGVSVLEAAAKASELSIETVEDALNHPDIPSGVKEILETYI